MQFEENNYQYCQQDSEPKFEGVPCCLYGDMKECIICRYARKYIKETIYHWKLGIWVLFCFKLDGQKISSEMLFGSMLCLLSWSRTTLAGLADVFHTRNTSCIHGFVLYLGHFNLSVEELKYEEPYSLRSEEPTLLLTCYSLVSHSNFCFISWGI